MSKNIFYHNPRCSKSREALALIDGKIKNLKIKEYLKEGFSKTELKNLFKNLNLKPIEAVRTKESIFKELGLKDKELNQDQWAQVIVENPVLLERPILSTPNGAAIGRPPEEILKLIK